MNSPFAKRNSSDRFSRGRARLGKDHTAIVLLNLAKESALLFITGIVADENFDLGAGPGTGLQCPGARQQIVPLSRQQN